MQLTLPAGVCKREGGGWGSLNHRCAFGREDSGMPQRHREALEGVCRAGGWMSGGGEGVCRVCGWVSGW